MHLLEEQGAHLDSLQFLTRSTLSKKATTGKRVGCIPLIMIKEKCFFYGCPELTWSSLDFFVMLCTKFEVGRSSYSCKARVSSKEYLVHLTCWMSCRQSNCNNAKKNRPEQLLFGACLWFLVKSEHVKRQNNTHPRKSTTADNGESNDKPKTHHQWKDTLA